MKSNFDVCKITLCLTLISFLHPLSVFANQDLLTAYCQSQTQIESVSDLEAAIETSHSKLGLREDEKINGVVISKNKNYVALDVLNTLRSKTSRIIVVSLKGKAIQSYEVKLDREGVSWCADVGAISNSGDFVMANIANPIGKHVPYRWCVVRLKDFSIVEKGLDRMLEKWSNH